MDVNRPIWPVLAGGFLGLVLIFGMLTADGTIEPSNWFRDYSGQKITSDLTVKTRYMNRETSSYIVKLEEFNTRYGMGDYWQVLYLDPFNGQITQSSFITGEQSAPEMYNRFPFRWDAECVVDTDLYGDLVLLDKIDYSTYAAIWRVKLKHTWRDDVWLFEVQSVR